MTAMPSRSPTVGFRAQISGASLWDLVQMECLSRSRQVFRVNGEGGVGYLYFAEGRVVHAATLKLIGEVAALEILGRRRVRAGGGVRPGPSRPPSKRRAKV